MTTDPRAAYLNAGVSTAGPTRLLLMLVDRLHLDVRRAADSQESGDHESARLHLLHAQDIVVELRSGLQVDVWSGGPGLAAIYDWLLTQLVRANVERDIEITRHCLDLAGQLASAWREAADSGASVAVGA